MKKITILTTIIALFAMMIACDNAGNMDMLKAKQQRAVDSLVNVQLNDLRSSLSSDCDQVFQEKVNARVDSLIAASGKKLTTTKKTTTKKTTATKPTAKPIPPKTTTPTTTAPPVTTKPATRADEQKGRRPNSKPAPTQLNKSDKSAADKQKGRRNRGNN